MLLLLKHVFILTPQESKQESKQSKYKCSMIRSKILKNKPSVQVEMPYTHNITSIRQESI